MYTLNEYVENWQKEKDFTWSSFWLMFGSFLDSFYKIKDIKMVEEKPRYSEKYH